MLSLKLARSIQDHWEEIASDAIRRIRQDKDVPHMAALSDHELREWAHNILGLGWSWPNMGPSESFSEQFRTLGRRRFENFIPLQESVRCLHILKQNLFDFTRSRGFAQNAIEVYAQEELEHGIGLIFDRLVYHVVCGYEEARKRANKTAA